MYLFIFLLATAVASQCTPESPSTIEQCEQISIQCPEAIYYFSDNDCDLDGGRCKIEGQQCDFTCAKSCMGFMVDGRPACFWENGICSIATYTEAVVFTSTRTPTQRQPSTSPSASPTVAPSNTPSETPTSSPSESPVPDQTPSPSTKAPSRRPTTSRPSRLPTRLPSSRRPTKRPSRAPSKPTKRPTTPRPSMVPEYESPGEYESRKPTKKGEYEIHYF